MALLKDLLVQGESVLVGDATAGTIYANAFVNINNPDSSYLLAADGSLVSSGNFAGSGHNHDDRYLKLSGGTMTGLITTTTGNNHNGIKVGSTYINSISGDLIFQNNSAIRFGGDSWDWNVWAGLKYVHSSKTVYLGLADNSAFTANSAQTGGKIYTPGIDNIYIGNGSYKIWHENNDGSGSGLDADKLDGLELHTGRNNEANKVVRTDANGYLQVGYINSSSGNENNNSSPDRVWGSNSSDSYLRTYMTSALSVGSAAALSAEIANDKLPTRLRQYITDGLTTEANGFGRITSSSPFTHLHTDAGDCMLVSTAYSSSWAAQLALDYRTNYLAIRNKNNGTWNSWAYPIMWQPDGYITDCNNVNSTGVFEHSNWSNRPSETVNGYGTLFNLRLYKGDNLYHRQLFFDCYDTDRIWTRSDNAGTWTSWVELVRNTGTWGISITGSAGSVAWGNVTGKPDTYPPSSHTHNVVYYVDTRDTNHSPTDVAGFNGLRIDFKNKSTSKIPSSGTWTTIFSMDGYSDTSGGYPGQLGFSMSDTNEYRPYYLRAPIDGSTWGSWRKILDSETIGICVTAGKFLIDPHLRKIDCCYKTDNAWNTEAYSTDGYIDDIIVTWKVGQTNKHIMVGLNSDPTTNASYTSMDYSLYTADDSIVYIYESGSYIGSYGAYSANDEFTIEYSAGTIKYYHNNVLCREIARTPGTKLYFDSSFYNGGFIYDYRFEKIGKVIGASASLWGTL